METVEYSPKDVCSSKMIFTIDNNTIKDMKVIGGCPGNLLGIRSLCIDKDIDEVIDKLKGIRCGFKPTSCPDQIATALLQYKEKNKH